MFAPAMEGSVEDSVNGDDEEVDKRERHLQQHYYGTTASSSTSASRDGSPHGVLQWSSDETAENTWDRLDCTTMNVRGDLYQYDQQKFPSGPALMTLESFDAFQTSRAVPCAVNDSRCEAHRIWKENPKKFVFVINWQMTPVQFVLTFTVDLRGDIFTADEPYARLFHRFIAMDTEERNKRLKVIPRVVEGPWIVKRAIGETPAIIGTKIDTQYFDGYRYMEVSIDVYSSQLARHIVSLVTDAAKKLVIDIGFVIEGESDDELPERMIGGFRVRYPDLDSLRRLEGSSLEMIAVLSVSEVGMLAAKVAELGLSPKPEWIESVGDDVNAGLSALMNSHLADCIAAGSLPQLGQDGVGHSLCSNGSKNRVLKMMLTDGVRRITAIEVVFINEIPQQLGRLPGAKLIISGSPDVCAACVLLYPCHVKFLGGFCPQLQISYKRSLSEKIARADPLRLAAPTDSEPISRSSTQTASAAPQPNLATEGGREARAQLDPQTMADTRDRCHNGMPNSGPNDGIFGGTMPSNSVASSAVHQPGEARATLSRGASSLPVFGDDDHVSRSSLQRVSTATSSSYDNHGQMAPSMGCQNPLATNTVRPTNQNVNRGVPSYIHPSSTSMTMLHCPPAVKQELTSSQDRTECRAVSAGPLQERPQSSSCGSGEPSELRLAKRVRTAEASEISVTQPMEDEGGIQRITEITPVSAITLSSGSENAAQSCEIEEIEDLIGASQEAREGGGTRQMSDGYSDGGGRKVVLDSGVNTFIAEIVEGDLPVTGYHGFFLVWRDIEGRVFASARADGISSGELAHLAQSLDEQRFED
ncbi:hypothetical protein FOL47_000691 [Perkinsus chesapeaki]|uniref:Protein ENHANCED DISEASE RESISTANCE 2 C-terminal domain-containing protein n=1 Tax=Perkinsus chesapeaki TaxID=330153 RepID=A0A7J6MLI2_PERCH|nr:hypothetical protein FOL47_000691 [Perkinsus chesapeaki]